VSAVLARLLVCAAIGGSLLAGGCAPRQTATPTPPPPLAVTAPMPAGPTPTAGSVLVTIFLRHDQSKTLDQINDELAKTGFKQKFPPPGIEVVSWYVMMGIGQVVTLRVPAERVREVNLAIEHAAWGAYRTEFYLPYDYKPIAEADRQKAQEAKPPKSK
jgi:hypothetical protein